MVKIRCIDSKSNFNLEKISSRKVFKVNAAFKKDVLDFTSFIVLNIALKKGNFAKSFEKIQIWKFAAYLRDF